MRFYSAKSIGGDETSKIRKEKRDIIGSDKLISDDKKSNGDDKKLLRELCAKIRFSGPITLAEYMREVLINPIQGVYMNKGALGADGHFITSPEISQMFGECLGVWLLNEWMKMGEPAPLQIVELGPGKGTLLNDILRTMSKLRPNVLEKLSLHLVEVSPDMRNMQKDMLCGNLESSADNDNTISKYGAKIHWHDSLRSVPKQFSLFLAHEFFDALPIHKFVKTQEGWRELLIDVDVDSEESKLRYILSKNETPSCVLVGKFVTSSQIEICPQAGIILNQISERLVEFGGLALIADYGSMNQQDSFRAFRKHKQVHPLDLPGSADLTADVDFKYLSTQISGDCSWFGPITQSHFLHSSGIVTRCEQLLKGGEDEKSIVAAYQTLTHPDKMGERFKFVSLFPSTMEPIHKVDPPVGFTGPEEPEIADTKFDDTKTSAI